MLCMYVYVNELQQLDVDYIDLQCNLKKLTAGF